MRIRTVEAIGLTYAVPAGRRYGMARGIGMRREATLLKVTTEDGVLGWGSPRVTMTCLELIRSAVEGSDLFGLPHLMSRFMADQYHMGIQNRIVTCLSGLDMALVDTEGLTIGLPWPNGWAAKCSTGPGLCLGRLHDARSGAVRPSSSGWPPPTAGPPGSRSTLVRGRSPAT